MGKYKKGILGYFRGKVGTVVGSIWKGINYMKSLPDVSNSEPTPAQLNARLKFAMVVGFFSRIKGVINIGYQKFNKGITPMNAANSYHLRSAVTGTSPNYTFDYDKVILSVGDLEEVIDLGVTNAESGELVFTWKANGPMEYGSATDLVSIVAYSESLFKFNQVLKVAPRSALTYTMSFPAEFLDTRVRIYLLLTSADGKECSTSQTLQPVVVI